MSGPGKQRVGKSKMAQKSTTVLEFEREDLGRKGERIKLLTKHDIVRRFTMHLFLVKCAGEHLEG